MWRLFLIQKRKCALTNKILNFGKRSRSVQCTASLDRIDSKKGYENGNVQWVHKDINKIKWDYDQDYFIEMCKLVAETHKQS